MDVKTDGLMPEEARRRLSEHGVAPATADRFAAIMEADFNSAYRQRHESTLERRLSADEDFAILGRGSSGKDAEEILRQVDRELAGRDVTAP